MSTINIQDYEQEENNGQSTQDQLMHEVGRAAISQTTNSKEIAEEPRAIEHADQTPEDKETIQDTAEFNKSNHELINDILKEKLNQGRELNTKIEAAEEQRDTIDKEIEVYTKEYNKKSPLAETAFNTFKDNFGQNFKVVLHPEDGEVRHFITTIQINDLKGVVHLLDDIERSNKEERLKVFSIDDNTDEKRELILDENSQSELNQIREAIEPYSQKRDVLLDIIKELKNDSSALSKQLGDLYQKFNWEIAPYIAEIDKKIELFSNEKLILDEELADSVLRLDEYNINRLFPEGTSDEENTAMAVAVVRAIEEQGRLDEIYDYDDRNGYPNVTWGISDNISTNLFELGAWADRPNPPFGTIKTDDSEIYPVVGYDEIDIVIRAYTQNNLIPVIDTVANLKGKGFYYDKDSIHKIAGLMTKNNIPSLGDRLPIHRHPESDSFAIPNSSDVLTAINSKDGKKFFIEKDAQNKELIKTLKPMLENIDPKIVNRYNIELAEAGPIRQRLAILRVLEGLDYSEPASAEAVDEIDKFYELSTLVDSVEFNEKADEETARKIIDDLLDSAYIGGDSFHPGILQKRLREAYRQLGVEYPYTDGVSGDEAKAKLKENFMPVIEHVIQARKLRDWNDIKLRYERSMRYDRAWRAPAGREEMYINGEWLHRKTFYNIPSTIEEVLNEERLWSELTEKIPQLNDFAMVGQIANTILDVSARKEREEAEEWQKRYESRKENPRKRTRISSSEIIN